MAKVSIIVPVYNAEKYISKCLESLLNQTLVDIEIILVNDGSTDDTEKVIKTYKDSRIKYYKKKNDSGYIGPTRNLGIDKSSGDYLMFIDSDDYISLNCVEKMYERAQKENLDIVISDYYEDRDGELKEIRFKSFDNTSLEEYPELLNNINLGPCNKLYKRHLFNDKNNRFEEKLKYEDAPFVCKMLVAAKKIGKIDEFLSYYVIHENSETTVRDKRIFDILDISKIIIDNLEKFDYLKKSLTNLIVMILTDYTIQQRYIENRKDRQEFINRAYIMLDNLDLNWKKCDYLKKIKFSKRIVKSNKFLTLIYCDIYYSVKIKNK